MPAYATIDDLVKRAALSELAEAAAPDYPEVDGTLLARHFAGEDLGAEPESTRVALAKAIERLQQVLDDSSAEIDGYIQTRYPSGLPEPSHALRIYCIDIALWRLFGGDRDSERRELYRRAGAYLAEVANGRVDLGSPDSSVEQTSQVLVRAPPQVFSAGALRGYADFWPASDRGR